MLSMPELRDIIWMLEIEPGWPICKVLCYCSSNPRGCYLGKITLCSTFSIPGLGQLGGCHRELTVHAAQLELVCLYYISLQVSQQPSNRLHVRITRDPSSARNSVAVTFHNEISMLPPLTLKQARKFCFSKDSAAKIYFLSPHKRC